jgi:dTDP-4-amino-4,6-dideoxygalactose transaminase
MIQIYSNSLGKEELKAVEQVFDSRWLGKGPKTAEFKEMFARKLITNCYEGVAFTTAAAKQLLTVSSCTEGLFQAVDLYVNKGDEVILPSISFIGAGNAIVAKGATPIWCDVDKRTLNPSVEDIEKCITSKTKAVIVLHYAGVPCDIERITELCSQHSIKLIEDNANSPFSRVNTKNTGTFGDIGLWSFDAMKQLVMGDGGMIYCRDEEDKNRLEKLTYLGLESTSGLSNTVDQKWWEFDISSPSRRSITNDIQAAIGIEQLKKIDLQIKRRKEIHDTYSTELSNLDWLDIPNKIARGTTSSYYMYHIQTKNRDELAKYLRDNGIYTTFRYYPLHWVKYFNSNKKLLGTEYAANHTLCIPLHQNLSDEDVNWVIKKIQLWKK